MVWIGEEPLFVQHTEMSLSPPPSHTLFSTFRYHLALSLLSPLPPQFPGVVHVVGVLWSAPTHPLQECVSDVTDLLRLSLPACLLLPAAFTAGGVAFKLHLCQVIHLLHGNTCKHRSKEKWWWGGRGDEEEQEE